MKRTISKPTLIQDGSNADNPGRSVGYWADTRSPDTEAAQESIIQSMLAGDDSSDFDDVVRYANADRDYRDAEHRVQERRSKKQKARHLPPDVGEELWTWITNLTGTDNFWRDLKRQMLELGKKANWAREYDRERWTVWDLPEFGKLYKNNQKVFESIMLTLGEDFIREKSSFLAGEAKEDDVGRWIGEVLPPVIPEFAEHLELYDQELEQAIQSSIDKRTALD
jgi:hypothetical protein